MTRRVTTLLKARVVGLIIFALIISHATAQNAVSPQTMVAWLRSLAIEGRVGLINSASPTDPRLFTQKVRDGRTVMEFIADTLGAAAAGDPTQPDLPHQWALLDEAASVLLAEADKMKELAAAKAGTPDEARFQNARKNYLAGAARLLKFYNVAAGKVFDGTAGPLANLPELPDWLLPGEIQIQEVSGAGRINTHTHEFSGRLSGLLKLPGLDATLTVRNASFDSKGNFDLTADGQANLPPNTPDHLTLIVPQRRPLTIHLGDDGKFRVSGGAEVSLVDGNKFDAFFDVDDPNYNFGFGFSGGITLGVAKQVSAIRPVVTLNTATPYTAPALDSLGEFFGTLGRGLESFVDESAGLTGPSASQAGVAPEFKEDRQVFPFDSLDAWITAIGNDTVRASLNGSISSTLGPVRETLSSLASDIQAARKPGAATLAQVRQLYRLTQLNGRFKQLLANPAAAQALGADASDFTTKTGAAADAALRAAVDLLNATPDTTDFRIGLAAIRLLSKAADSSSLTPAAAGLNASQALAKAGKWREDLFRQFGFNRDATVSDQPRVAALTATDLRVLTLAAFELDTMNLRLGGPALNLAGSFARREFENVRNAYNLAVSRNEADTRALYSARLLELAGLRSAIAFQATDPELQFATVAFADTLDALSVANGSGAKGQAIASAFMAGAVSSLASDDQGMFRRKAELFGETEPVPDFSTTLSFAFYRHSFFQRLSTAVRNLQSAGLLQSADLARLKSDVAALTRQRRDAATARFSTAAQVAQDFNGAERLLIDLLDSIGLLEDFVPEETALLADVKASWLSLHGLWLPLAEARKAHSLLSTYIRELANVTIRYGDGLPAGLSTDLRRSGSEAVVTLAHVTDALAVQVNALADNSLLFNLPGSVRIPRLSGELAFNRITGAWSVGFGGRLELPNANFSLEVVHASISSAGAYDMTLAAAGDLGVGDRNRVKLTLTSLHGAGSRNGPFAIDGQGTINIDAGAGFAAGPSVVVTASYDSGRGEFALGATTSNLRLSDQLALLNGSVAASFASGHAQGALTISGKLGLLARQPLPANRALTDTDFWLTIDAQPTTFTYSDHDVTAQFTGGSITLPPDLFRQDSAAAPSDAPPVTVGITGTLCVRYDFVQNRIEFCGTPGQPFTLALQHLKLQLPELPGLALTIDAATLELSGTQFPLLKNLTAGLTLPLPGADATDTNQNHGALLSMNAQNWRIDGLPEAASIALGSDLELANFSGFTFDVLTGSGLSFASTLVNNQRHTTFTFTGNLRAGFDQRVLSDDASGTAVRFTAQGSFAWDMQNLPVLVLNTVRFDGTFRLGTDGPRITGLNAGDLAHLSFSGLENSFHQSINRPLIIGIEGALEVPNTIKFGLIDSKFILDGSGIRFVPGGAQAELGNQTLDVVQNALPVYLSKAGLSFKNPNLPLIPAANGSGLFDLANVIVTISGGVNLPSKTALDAGAPGFAGEVNDLAMSLNRDAQHNLVPVFSLNGLGVELKNVDIPPLGALTGGLYVGNLNDAENLYFAGLVSGKVNDVGAAITLAVHRKKGLLGSCFELDVGPAGVPIDGGTLGGILLTGGKGGLSFGNQFADPCDFRSYIQFQTVNGTRQPVNNGPTATFDPTGSPTPPTVPPTPPAPDANSCVIGQFPPPTINPLCELHPTIANRIIFKGTALNESQLNALGLTRGSLPASLNAAVAFAVGKIAQPAHDLRNQLVGVVPQTVPIETKNFYTDLLDKQIRQLENTATTLLANTLGAALSQNPNASLYNAIVTAAAQGIPCLDATLKLQGNFSHAAVSTVMKGEGSVTVSTTGSAIMEGTVKLVGIPIGEGTLAFSLTDSQGNINPSFGGVIHAGVGPLTLGDMSLAYQCDGCFDTVINAFGVFLQTNGQNLAADTKGLLMEIMNRSVPLPQPRPLTGDPATFFAQLTPRQKLGYIVSLFNVIDVVAKGESMAGIAPQTVGGFVTSFRQFVSDVATQVNPRFCFQAKVRPALFGFPLIPGPTPLDARFAYERIHDATLNQDFQQLSANAVFSPAFILASLSSGSFAVLVPGTDQANMGFSFRMPAFTPQTVELAMNNPGQFAASQFTSFVQDSTFTFGYAFMPLGIPLAEGQARVVMPRLLNHPSNPNRVGGPWQLPTGQTVATREEIILAALVRARLQDPNWRGQRGELDDLFTAPFNPPPAPGSAEERIALIATRLSAQQMAQIGFAEDYFPHGGIIGAAQLKLPSVIAQAPPLSLIANVFDTSNPNWVTDAQNLFNNYLTANTVVGQMGMYIPAPNPPFGFDFSTATAEDLIRQISQADALGIIKKTVPNGVYPFDQVLLSGWMRAQVLGMPLGEGSVTLDGNSGSFRVHAGVPQGTWLRDFIGANADLEIRKPVFMNGTPAGNSIEELYAAVPKKTVQERFAERQGQIGANPSAQFIADTVSMIEQTLPKASLEMSAQMQIPPGLQSVLKQKAGTALSFFAFSPAFDPAFGLNGAGAADDDTSPYAVAKRRGGLGLRGQFDLGLNFNDPNPANRITISIPDASFSVTPDANIGLFPALSAQLKLADVNLPGVPRMSSGTIAFSSSPDNLAPYIGLGATVQPFDILIPIPGGQSVPIAQFRPRVVGASVGGSLNIFRDDSVPTTKTGARLSIDAMRVIMPLLGPNVAMTIYGQQNGSTFTPFTFSTTSTEHWNATVKIHAASSETSPPIFGICDPRAVTQDAQGNWVGDPATCAMAFALTQPIVGTMEGDGMQTLRLTVTLPKLANVTFFPNSDTRTDVPSIGSTSSGILMVEKSASDGLPRFYVDFGTNNNIGLPGVLSATGHFEFGYNPTAVPGPLTRTPASIAFPSTEICTNTPVVRQVTITNTRSEPVNALLRVSSPNDFTVTQTEFSLDRNGASRVVDVLFHPRTIGAKSAILFIDSDNPDSPTLTVSLTGTGTATPRYVQSRDQIAFGDTVAGQVAAGTVVVGNEGCGALTINSVALSGTDPSAFTVSPAGAVVLQAGQSRLYRVEFAPTAVPIGTNTSLPHSATLTVATVQSGSHTIALSGNATDSRWVTLLDSDIAGPTRNFNDILMLDAKNGWVVGDGGWIYETHNGGRSWSSRVLTPFDLHALHAQASLSTPLLAVYHFEEPPGSTKYRDDGPNGFTANAEVSPTTAVPTIGFSSGRFGSGLAFDGVDDAANIATALVLSNSSSISLWANISATPSSDVLLAQTDPTVNATIVSLETTASAYRVRFGTQLFTGGSITSGWQHLVLTLAYNSSSNTTSAQLFRNGTALWTNVFTNALPTATSRIWGIGARYQTFSSRVSFFPGQLDELYFFSGVLSAAEISALGKSDGGLRLAIAGDNGTILQSETLGHTWHKAFDLNPDGWRQRQGLFYDYDWKGVTVPSSGQIVLGGTRRLSTGLAVNQGVVMIEDLFQGHYDEVSFFRGGTSGNSVDIVFNDIISSGNKVYGFTREGRVFVSPASFSSDWTQHGTLDVNLSLNRAAFVSSSSYVAVGDAGTIIRSSAGAAPVVITHGLTANNLRGISWVGVNSATIPEVHVVGDNGVYLNSSDLGLNWVKTADGLTGNNRAVAARISGTGYESWVAGENHQIQYRPPQPQVAPFITFYPGELDFGILTLGQTRTLPVEIRNRGKRDLQLTLLSVTGTGFTLAQSSVSKMSPGDAVVVQVRFKPTVETAHAQGDLALTANDGNPTYHVPLVGRATGLEWQPVTLSEAGTALSGDVIDLAFTTDTTGYALLSGRLMKTTDGGLNWTPISPSSGSVIISFSFRSIAARRFGSSDVIYLAGSSRNVLSGLTSGLIWRSADGGATWATRTPQGTGGHPIGDVSVLYEDANAAVVVTSDPSTHDADVWQTTDGGLNWSTKSRPPSETVIGSTTNKAFDGGRILIEELANTTPASGGWTVIATARGAIYSRGFNEEWPYVTVFPVTSGQEQLQFHTNQPIKAIQFGRGGFNLLNSGWLVGVQGLYWRWQPIPPNSSPFAGTESEWVPASNQEIFGRTDLEAISFSTNNLNGWIVGGNTIFVSKDGGRSWDTDFAAGETSALKSVFGRSVSNAWAGGSLAGKATVWRYRPGAIPAQGILLANDVQIFPASILPGNSVTNTLTIQNIGNATLGLQHIGLESDDRLVRFRIVGAAPKTLAASASSTVQVAFDALADPVDVEALAPLFFHRFEQGFTDTKFYDSGPAHVDIDFNGVRTVPVANRPRIVASDIQRDRSLSFDGNDYAEVPGPEIFPSDFSISLWVNPTTTTDGQTFIAKNSSTGGKLLTFGFFHGGYEVNLRGFLFTGGTKKTGWQHLVVTGSKVPASSVTTVSVYRNGELLWQQNLSAVLGTATGLPWTLGGEWNAGPSMASQLTGRLDDVALFNRVLSEGEIQALASKSPLCGQHRARLVFQSNSETGERTTELRATVQETGGLVVIDTVPTGATVKVDGVDYPTPVSFAVSCTVSTPKEWLERSQHTIEAPAALALLANGNTLTYGFSEWSLQNAGTRILSVVASTNLGRLLARYRLDNVTVPSPGGPAQPQAQFAAAMVTVAPGLETAVAGTPAGPWFRLTNGKLTVPSLGTDGFTITGELFASLTRVKGSLTSSALSWPTNGDAFLQVGASQWQLDLLAGNHFLLKAHPPSLSLLGYGVAPDGDFTLSFDFVTNTYTASFDLRQDFRPVPDFFEFTKNSTTARAGVTLGVTLPSKQPPIFAMQLDGRVRFLRLPANVTGQNGWAVDQNISFGFNSANFNISLKNDIIGAANWPATLFSGGPIALSGGDVRLARLNNGPISLNLVSLNLNVNGTQAATVSGSIDTESNLSLSGSIPGGTNLNLINGGRFTLASRTGGALNFDMSLRALPSPQIKLNLPAMKVRCTPGAGVDPLEVNVPAIAFDSSGAFDTGKIALPSGVFFDGIAVNKPSDAELDKNYIRLSRDRDGKVAFKLRAQESFVIPGVLSCRNDLKVTIDSTDVSASYRGNFCVLPEPISLNYDANSSCQFSGSAFGQTIFLGTGCVGVRNDATGLCAGTCN